MLFRSPAGRADVLAAAHRLQPAALRDMALQDERRAGGGAGDEGLAGEFTGLTAIVAFVLLLPSLSLLLGDLTRGPRLTEIVLLVICFLMLNQPSLIVGISPEYYAPGRTICARALAAGFLAAAFLKRILGQRTSH